MKAADLPFYEQSYTFKQSKYGLYCPINQAHSAHSKDFAVRYRERIYYPSGPEARQMMLTDPAKWTIGRQTVPKDVSIVPQCLVLGPPKSGKSTLC